VRAALRKTQEEMKKHAVKEWNKGNKVMLSTKNLVFKERPVKKLVD